MTENDILEIYKKISFEGALKGLNKKLYPKWVKDLAKQIWDYSVKVKDEQWSDAQVTDIIRKCLDKNKDVILNSLDEKTEEKE